MTTPDTKAIRAKAKMWHLPAGIADDILALCEALGELRADIETCTAKRDEWADRAMTELGNVLDLRAEIERLQTIIGNLHAVEEKHRETANAQFHRANRLRADNERLRKAAGVVSAVLQSERARLGGQPFTGNWSIPQIGFRGTVDDALDMADAALAQKGAAP